MKTVTELNKLPQHLLYFLYMAPSGFFLFSDLKRMLAEKKFEANEEVTAETKAYFQAQENSIVEMQS